MSRFYGFGLLIVLATIAISSVICVTAASRQPSRSRRAAEDLGPASLPLGSFQLVERSGHAVAAGDLADRVAIASFIFTRCPLSCPRITGVMQSLQGRLAGTSVLLLSFSVDPEYDTPAVLKSYADRYGASPDRWWFLTGPKSDIYDLIRDRFKLSVMESPGPPGSDTEAFVHSDRLALIDHDRIVGLFESNDPGALEALVVQAKRRALPTGVARLPSVNAGLNGLSACLLLAGWYFIRRHRARPAERSQTQSIGSDQGVIGTAPLVKGHVACMIAAVCTSTLFLGCYLYYHYHAGSMPFQQGGVPRVAYLSILLSHTVLATASVPLIVVTLWRAWRGRYHRHASVASLTLPIWFYVAVTGVVVYLLLYHWPAMEAGTSLSP